VRLAAASILAAFLAGGWQAPARPDFCGYWVWNSARTEAVTGTTPPQPQGVVEWTITQAADTITMVRPWPTGPEQRYVYKLDDTESENTISTTVYHTRSRWDGEKLIIEGTMVTIGDNSEVTGTMRQVMWLTASGALATETTRRGGARSGVAMKPIVNGPFVQVYVRTVRK
jgi:hypothetical protein